MEARKFSRVFSPLVAALCALSSVAEAQFQCYQPDHYGSGSPGSGGILPHIDIGGGSPYLGNQAFSLEARNALGGAATGLLLGLTTASIPVLGVRILVLPIESRFSMASGAGPGTGRASYSIPVPSEPSIAGLSVHAQVIVLDPGAPQGLATTDGLTLEVQRTPAFSAGVIPNGNFFGFYHPADSSWHLRLTRPGWNVPIQELVFSFGNPGDVPLVGDWDGDGQETPGIWSNGWWTLSNSLDGSSPLSPFPYGSPSATPIVGDWDGDGVDTVGAVVIGQFLLRNTNDSGPVDYRYSFGLVGDTPIVGDWDGDGVDTVGVRGSVGSPRDITVELTNKRVPSHPRDYDVSFTMGNAGAQPIVGDWNEDRVDTVGVRMGGRWFMMSDNRGSPRRMETDMVLEVFGAPADVPVAGNWQPCTGRDNGNAPAALATFFPLAADWQSPTPGNFQKWRDRGINSMVRVPSYCNTPTCNIESWTAEANRLGLKMIRQPRSNAALDAQEQNLLAWHIGDEPDLPSGRGIAFVQSEYQRLTQVLRSNNFSMPMFANLSGGQILHRDDGCDGPGDDSVSMNCYRDFLAVSDWASFDIYPVNGGDPDKGIEVIGKIFDRLRRWGGGKPRFGYVECVSFSGNSMTGPNRDQFRAEIWSSIIHGARGIFYFVAGGCDPCTNEDGMSPSIVGEMILQNNRITSLAPALQSAIDPPYVGIRVSPPLEVSWRVWQDRKYFIVLNLSSNAVNGQMEVVGFTPVLDFVVEGENRVVGRSGVRTITDIFGPYEVHIYSTR